MSRARLTVQLAADSWTGGVTRTHPATRLRVRTAALHDPVTLVVEVTAPEALPEAVATLVDADAVDTVHILDRTEDRVVAHIVAETAPALRAAGAETPPVFPFPVADGEAEWTVVAPSDALSALGNALDDAGVAFTVKTVSASVDPTDPLTPRQRRVARAAVDRGYYETPRGCSLADVADALGLAPSTVSETLRRAERAALGEYVGGGSP